MKRLKKSLAKMKLFLQLTAAVSFLGACSVESHSPETIESPAAYEASLNQAEDKKMTESEELAVHYIDVGQANATLFEFASDDEEYAILYDTGDWTSTDVVDYLTDKEIQELDLVIASHPDADHIGQLDKVLEQFEVGEVWMSGNTTSSDVFIRSLEAIQKFEVGYYEPRAGEQFDIGPLSMEILHPSVLTSDTNADSISMFVSYGEVDFLFTGDAGKKQEMEMVNSGMNLDAEILALGHHGSDTSSAPAFIDAVSPEVAIYSAGAGNSYGHPQTSVVSLIQEKGIALYGTDQNGTIIVRTDGESYHIETVRDESKMQKDTENSLAGKIDLNTASYEELLEIAHIGPERAEDIISLRPLEKIEDLQKVNGIGPSRLEDIITEGKAYVGGN